jgi:hypothetical protein
MYNKYAFMSRYFTLVAKNATPISIANALPRLILAVAVLAPGVGRAHGAQFAFPTLSAAERFEKRGESENALCSKSWEMRSRWEFVSLSHLFQ